MTTEELLALAVLKGDRSAIRPLLDALMEQYQAGGQLVYPQKIVTADHKNLRAVVYYQKHVDGVDYEPDFEHTDELVKGWLAGEEPVIQLVDVDRVEVYEFPNQQKETT